MKIIAIDNNYRVKPDSKPCMLLLADSCLLQKGRPFFIPEMEGGVNLYPSLVIKIGRLGKHISPRFANRYWNQYGVMIQARADEYAESLKGKGLFPTEAYLFDNCAILGQLMMKSEGNPDFTVYKNGQEIMKWEANDLNLDIDHIIQFVSENNTLKTGDLIMVGIPQEGFPVAVNDTITINFNNTTLRFNIK